MDYMEDFMLAKYHMSIANRMLGTYDKYPDKRVLIGVVNETEKGVSKLIRSLMIMENVRGDFKIFEKKVAFKFLKSDEIDAIRKIVELKSAQKNSPVEFLKQEKIIFLINGKYVILTIDRLRIFIDTINTSIKRLSKIFRQV